MSRTIGNAALVVTALILLLAACGSTHGRESESVAINVSGARHEDLPEGRPLLVSSACETTVKPGPYLRPPLGNDGERGVIVIENAHDVVLDLTDVVLRGTRAGNDLDACEGYGIVLRDSDRILVRGGMIGGYRVCVAAFNCHDVRMEDVHFDGWYGMRLLSTSVAENEADWLFPHENDNAEWMQNYGAAIALEDCTHATISGCRGRHGQNGILLTRSDDCLLHDDDFSFLSGWGLALYRSSRNKVSHCIFDYCVRGYSHEVYWRGQDSAGILLFERSSDNVFAHCSATHGGDGVFLFAGNDTVQGHAFERGEMDAGGSDRNVWYECDFSYAVANAIEATFSSGNWAIADRLDGAHQHGVWGGYSRRMVVLECEIAHVLGGGVSIEHGQECAIVGNRIEDDDIGLELWWDEDKDLVGGPFGQHRETSSRDPYIAHNRFDDNARDIDITQTTGVFFHDNETDSKRGSIKFESVTMEGPAKSAADTENPDAAMRRLLASPTGGMPSGRVFSSSLRTALAHGQTQPEWVARARAWTAPKLPGTLVTSARERGDEGGLETIVMGEWGPWDFRSGEPRPMQRTPGGLFADVKWNAAWFKWTPSGGDVVGTDPRKDVDAWRALSQSPSVSGEATTWTDPWGGSKPVREKVGSDHFGLIARTSLEIKDGGPHRLSVTSDDGVRVMIDGETVLENWTWHGPTRDSADVDLSVGKHDIVLEYFQIDGASALAVELERVR